MPETRLKLNQRLLTEAEQDLEYAESINDTDNIKALTREIQRYQARIQQLQSEQ